jgi:parvulin-like peptidyl-prolyl isomerase
MLTSIGSRRPKIEGMTRLASQTSVFIRVHPPRGCVHCWGVALACSLCQAAVAAEIVAKVNGEPVYASEIQAELRAAFGDKQLSGDDQRRLGRAALDQVIDRRLVLAFFNKTGQAASKTDVDLELSRFENELKSQNLTLTQHSERVGLSEDDIRRALAWKISWKRYCEKQLTPQNLEKYFDQHRQDFDGRQLRVAQILFKRKPDSDAATSAAAVERAAKLRADIVSGKISFADAAREQSDAPSKAVGGDIGWIERHRPMPEDFCRAAFALKPGEVSPPFESPFGIHLVTVLEERPGTLTARDVDGELRPATIAYLFRFLADKERATAKIEYVEAH